MGTEQSVGLESSRKLMGARYNGKKQRMKKPGRRLVRSPNRDLSDKRFNKTMKSPKTSKPEKILNLSP